MQMGEEREVVVRTTLRELTIYLVFLAILCIVTLSSMSTDMFRYTDIIRNQFSTYSSINQVDKFWEVSELIHVFIIFYNWGGNIVLEVL